MNDCLLKLFMIVGFLKERPVSPPPQSIVKPFTPAKLQKYLFKYQEKKFFFIILLISFVKILPTKHLNRIQINLFPSFL